MLTDKIAVVTGAGQGVGRGIALALAAEGATTVVVVTRCYAPPWHSGDRSAGW